MSKNTLDSEELAVRPLTTARIPTRDGEYQLTLYDNSEDEKDHLALIYGDISDGRDVLVRIHSECFTGDVLGSLRCDCGEQLDASMRMIADYGSGIVLYLRQEGRGIGLLSKLKAYNLQDEGYDTVDANLALGHGADERDYTIAAQILEDLDVSSVRLITNNPEKIEGLQEADIEVIERIPIQPLPNEHNRAYLHTKVDRMRHLMELDPTQYRQHSVPASATQTLRQRIEAHRQHARRPFVTLSYVQSLDGMIARPYDQRLAIESDESALFVQQLRGAHDAVLLGVNAILAVDPPSVGRSGDETPLRPVVLDPRLQFPVTARLLRSGSPRPILATNEQSRPDQINALEAAGAHVLRIPCDNTGLSLDILLQQLIEQGVESLVVEGGDDVVMDFVRQGLADHVAIIITPRYANAPGGGTPSAGTQRLRSTESLPRLTNVRYQQLGEDVVLQGDPE